MRDVIKRAKKGDAEAISIIYEEYFDRVYRYIAGRVGEQDAEDLTQDVFIKVMSSLPKIRGDSISSYIFKVARNRVIDFLRRKKEPVPRNLPSQEGDYAEEREDLRRAMEKLTDLQREVLILRFFSDLPIKEVARILGKKEGAIKVIQHDAIKALRRYLET